MDPENPRKASSLDLDDVEEILASCLLRPEAEIAIAVERAVERHPRQAEELRRRYGALQELGVTPPPTDELSRLPSVLGDFRLLRRIGQGGMGVVYEADQLSIGRRIALKLVRPELLYFKGVRTRFHREAEAVGRLRHPGIVPVHAVGEERGIPYFAMELVEGCTLADLIRSLKDSSPSELTGESMLRAVEEHGPPRPDSGESETLARSRWTDVCLLLVRQVAHALEHAHARGILHRDVKPSNVMVTSTGRAMLLDFGLARIVDASELTRSGTEIGSLPYMSPERLRDPKRANDERSDVYSLGVLLYELLGLENPFLRDDPERCRQLILSGASPRLRTLTPAVPADAETVCLGAMASDPERRYRTAADFARDLGNVLEHRPIEARRPGPLVRLRAWAAQRRGAAAAVGLALAVMIVGPLLFAIHERRARRAVSAEKTRAEERLGIARAAVQDMLTRVGVADLHDAPGMTELRIDLLKDALRHHAAFLAAAPDDSSVRLEAARTRRLLADLESAVGRDDDASENYASAIRLLRRLDSAPARAELGAALVRDARLREARGDARSALEVTNQALEILDGPTNRDVSTRDLVECLLLRGRLRAPSSPEEARNDFARAALLAEAGERADGSERSTLGAAAARRELARVAAVQERWSESEAALRAARASIERVFGAAPTDPNAIQQLAAIDAHLALVFRRTDRADESEAAMRRAVALYRRFICDFTPQPMARAGLARCLFGLARVVAVEERETLLRESVEVLQGLLSDRPARGLEVALADSLGDLGRHLARTERMAEGVELLGRTATRLERLLRQAPDDVLRRGWAFTLNQRSDLLLRLGRHAEAVADIARLTHDADSPVEREILRRLRNCIEAADGDASLDAAARDAAVRRYSDLLDRLEDLAGDGGADER